MLRPILIAAAFAMACAAVYGCASDNGALRQAAIEECLVLHPRVNPPDESCISEVQSDVRAAQEYRAPPPSKGKSKSKSKRR